MAIVFLLALVGCEPATAVLSPPDASLGLDDTGALPTDPGIEPGDDVVDPGPTPPDFSSFSSWEGERVFTFKEVFGQQCVDSLFEDGEEVTGRPEHQALVDACGDCDQVYVLDTDPGFLCGGDQWGVPVATRVGRGLAFELDGSVRIFSLSEDRDGVSQELLATGKLLGDEITYTYSGSVSGWDFDVTGSIVLD